MTIEEIRKNAPQGATHYATPMGKLIYIKDCFSSRRYWNKEKNRWLVFNFHSPSIMPL